jgi:cytochrome P450
MKLNKDWYYYRFVGTSDAAFGTASFSQHRQRRKAFNRFFSSSAILDFEAQVQKCVLQLCDRLEEHRNTNKPVILASAFRSLATDVISQYALPQGFDLLSSRDFGEDYNNVNRKLSGVAAYNRHLPFILPTVLMLPTWLLRLTGSPGMLQMLDFQGVRALVLRFEVRLTCF